MPLAVRCPACGQGHKAPERAAGRTVACMACGAAMTVPQPEPPPEPEYSLVSLLDDIPAIERSAPPKATPATPPGEHSSSQTSRPKSKPADANGFVGDRQFATWRRQLHWLLVLALIPLVVSLLTTAPEEASFVERLFETAEEASLSETAEAGGATETSEV